MTSKTLQQRARPLIAVSMPATDVRATASGGGGWSAPPRSSRRARADHRRPPRPDLMHVRATERPTRTITMQPEDIR